MNVPVLLTTKIDTTLLTRQRDLIAKMIAELDNGRFGIAIKRDRAELTGIQGVLDTIARAAGSDEYVDDGMAPDCPGCITLDLCDDCEYTADSAVDPVCTEDFIRAELER